METSPKRFIVTGYGIKDFLLNYKITNREIEEVNQSIK